MRLKALVTALLIAALAASAAFAAPARAHEEPPADPAAAAEMQRAKEEYQAAKQRAQEEYEAAKARAREQIEAAKERLEQARQRAKEARERAKEARRGCRPKVAYILVGEFKSLGADSLVMTVERSNRHARYLVGKDATVKLGERAARRLKEHAPAAGDLLLVHARGCKRADDASRALEAKQVVNLDAEDKEEDEKKDEETTPAPPPPPSPAP